MDKPERVALTRRRFLGWSQFALATLGAGNLLRATPAAAAMASSTDEGVDYYGKLGV